MENFFESQLLKSDSITHRFFTRNGGVSTGRFSSLNFCGKAGDSQINISQNKEVIAKSFGLNKDAIKLLNQVHGRDVVTVDKLNFRADLSGIKADAMVTNLPDVILGVVTADCCPVLFMDQNAKVIGAAHSGWRSAIAGIVESTIAAMEKIGARKSDIKIAIGPAIMWDSYEVDSAFKMEFEEHAAGNAKFFRPSKNTGYYMFDLKGYVEQRALDAGITQIENLAMDTYSMEENFFSCRRAYHRGEKGFGDQMSAICLQSVILNPQKKLELDGYRPLS